MIFFLLFPLVGMAQKVLFLEVRQPSELVFSGGRQDTTIEVGNSVVLATDQVITGGTGSYHFLWSPALSLDDPTSFHPKATPSDTTHYLLTVTDERGCRIQTGYTVYVTPPLVGVGVTDRDAGLQAFIFPNPSTGVFTIRLTGAPSSTLELTVAGEDGKRWVQHTISHFSGHFEEVLSLPLPPGVYLLRAISQREVAYIKFMVT